MDWIIETERLGLRQIKRADYEALCLILQDPEVMYAWEHGFSDEEVKDWIEENLRRYVHDGFSYYAAIEKERNCLIGVMGPLLEVTEGESHVGIGYILRKDVWRRGFALEGAAACVSYIWEKLGAPVVTAQIKTDNTASQKVAERLGMRIEKKFIKNYRGKERPHYLYCLECNTIKPL